MGGKSVSKFRVGSMQYMEVSEALWKLYNLLGKNVGVFPTITTKDYLEKIMVDEISHNYTHIEVPDNVGEALVILHKSISKNLEEAFNAGVRKGSNILLMLNEGKISMDDFSKQTA